MYVGQRKIKLLVLIIILFLIGIIILVKKNLSYYKIEDKSNSIEKFEKNNMDIGSVSWLRIQGTNIDFPIIYAYSGYDLTNPENEIGWTSCGSRNIYDRILISSHNMRNLSSKPLVGRKNFERFEQLMSFIYYDFIKENKYIQYSVKNKNYLYKIYSIYLIDDYELDKTCGNTDKNDIEEYIKKAKKKSIYDIDVDVNKKDKLITLSTCTRFDGSDTESFVVEGRLVRKHEIINDFKVKENKKYKKIEKKLKE